MKRIILFLLLAYPTLLQAQEDLLGNALRMFGLDSMKVGYKPQPAWSTTDRSDPFRLRYFDGLLARPMKIPNFTREMLWRYNVWITGDSANFGTPKLREVRPLAGLVMNSARNLGYDIGRYGFDYTPALAAAAPLESAVRGIYESRGRTLGSNIVYPLPTQDWTDLEKKFGAQIRALPADLQQALASIVTAAAEAARWRDDALRSIPREQWRHIFESTTLEESQCDAHTFDQIVYDAAVAYDGSSMAYGATLLAQAVEKALPTIRRHGGGNLSLDIPTPIGRIVLSGSSKDMHYAPDCAVLVDLGGDDSYLGAAAATSPDLPVSVLIDLSGDDAYRNDHEGIPSQGAGVLGIALLLDLGGDDTYATKTFSQGCGRFGVGVLYDAVGNDRYASLGFSQGAGLYGIGILFDRAGDDMYNTVYYAQGYGFSLGLGLLADAAGNDAYVADDTELTHVGDETPKHNESDAQGYGAGRRADHMDGHSMSGGLGILHDLAGNDSYSAGVFAQGSAYWYGYGVLSDHAGDDTYRGVFFNLGASAHFAIGVQFDDSGNDRSDCVMTLGFGSAHDGSAAFYIDLDGDDTYTMSAADSNACSLGTALNNSFAVFANIRGNDQYRPLGNAYGYATARHHGEWPVYAPSTGFFFDIGGSDTYSGRFASENTEWKEQFSPKEGVFGYGIDAPAGMIRFE